jgi:hypothetical protein
MLSTGIAISIIILTTLFTSHGKSAPSCLFSSILNKLHTIGIYLDIKYHYFSSNHPSIALTLRSIATMLSQKDDIKFEESVDVNHLHRVACMEGLTILKILERLKLLMTFLFEILQKTE